MKYAYTPDQMGGQYRNILCGTCGVIGVGSAVVCLHCGLFVRTPTTTTTTTGFD